MRISDWSSDVCSSDLIWNTHWHPDHTGGNAAIKEATGCTITGPAAEFARIPTLDVQVKGGDTVRLGEHAADVWDVPAHTAGHIAYHFAADAAIFVGDTMFAMGCGRSEEHTSELQSLMRISYAVFCLKKKKKTKN